MPAPLVSIIVPIYNVAPWLEACLDSIQAQSLNDWEAILVDDGSTDTSGTIAAEYAARDARFKLIRQTNTGLGGARNTGAAAATGAYLFFLDSDDMISQKTLQNMVELAAANQAQLVVGSLFTFPDGVDIDMRKTYPAEHAFIKEFSGLPSAFTWQVLNTRLNAFQALYADMNLCIACAKLFHTATWRRLGCGAPDDVRMAEDFVAVKTFVFSGAIMAIYPQAAVLYRKRPGSATTRRSAKPFAYFQVYPHALAMFRQSSLWATEQYNIHRMLLQHLHSHMVMLTAYPLWWRFYRQSAALIAAWPSLPPLPPTEQRLLHLYRAGTFPAFIWLAVRYWFLGRILVKLGLRKP